MNKKTEQEIKKIILPKLFRKIKFYPRNKIFFNGEDNLIISARRKNKSVILRVTPEKCKTYNETLSELDIIEHLIKAGIPAAKPLYIYENEMTLRINYKENYYTICAFEKAKGRLINPEDREPNVYDRKRHKNIDKIFYKFGKYVAIMHKELGPYNSQMPEFIRQNVSNHLARKYEAIEEDKSILKRYEKYVEKVNTIPRSKKNFGLVHFDLHTSNFHVYKNDITFFDFTDTQYAYYMWDIAKVFFSNTPFNLNSKKDLELFSRKYNNFLKGYKDVRALSMRDIERVKLFLKVMELRMYLGLKEYFRKEPDDIYAWDRGFLKNRKEYIENNYTVFEAMKKHLRPRKSAV